MDIEIHGLALSAQGMISEDVDTLFNDILFIPKHTCSPNEFGTTKIFKYSFGKSGESMYIRYYLGDDKSNLNLNLHGSFFDNSPDFSLKKLLVFVRGFKHTFKQLDIAFNDNKKCLDKKQLLHWCKDSDRYCKGDLVSRQVPYTVYGNRKLVRIQLGSARSSSNYGTIYRRPDTKLWRVEIKLKHDGKIKYLLDQYHDRKRQQFEAKCLKVLVKCINFVTPGSKDKGKARKQPSWSDFLGSDIKKINWNKIYKKRSKSRQKSDKEVFDKRIRRIAKTKENLIKKYRDTHSADDINRLIADASSTTIDINDSENDIFSN